MLFVELKNLDQFQVGDGGNGWCPEVFTKHMPPIDSIYDVSWEAANLELRWEVFGDHYRGRIRLVEKK